jgi:putative toxin-antitoxin system antitoxin component (TIGR02293 family)
MTTAESVRIVELLGGRRAIGSLPGSELDLVALVRRGIPFPSFRNASAELHLSLREIERVLGLSARSIQRRRAGRLTPIESERILRLIRVAARAETVLGQPAAALDWLTSPNRALGGVPPMDLLDTDLGAKQVFDVLGRIEHGVFS